MRSPSVKLALIFSAAATLAGACSSVAVDTKSTSNASGSATGAGGAASASSSSGVIEDVGGGTGFGGFPGTTSGAGGTGGSPSMAGMFDCNGCLCDGATHYCELQFGGAAPPPGPPPEPMCDADAGPIRCKPIPSACLPMATCQCIYPQEGPCTCKVDPGGITVTCNLP
ncbi:MAG: hypothetical protein ABJE95_23280 [Byssovorax sp.]